MRPSWKYTPASQNGDIDYPEGQRTYHEPSAFRRSRITFKYTDARGQTTERWITEINMPGMFILDEWKDFMVDAGHPAEYVDCFVFDLGSELYGGQDEYIYDLRRRQFRGLAIELYQTGKILACLWTKRLTKRLIKW